MIEDQTFREYCIKDCQATSMSLHALIKDVKELGAWDHYTRIIQPLTEIVLHLNQKGMLIDNTKREAAAIQLTEQSDVIKSKIYDMLGGEYNIRGNEIKDFFYKELGLNAGRSTGSLDKVAVAKLSNKYPDLSYLFNSIIEAKHLDHIKNAFILAIQPGEDGIIYPNYKIGPLTGRLACKKPNYQNIPEGISRELFIPRPGKMFIYADYSNLEVRILAVLANETEMLRVLAAGKDIHSYTASILFKLPPGVKESPIQRKIAKNVFFGIVSYGGSVEGIKERLDYELSHLSVQELYTLVNGYFEAHPRLKEFRTWIEKEFTAKKMLRNAFGRPRFFFGRAKDSLRQAYNFPIQSSAADLKNIAVIETHKMFPDTLVLEVHDSMMWEVDEDKVEHIQKELVAYLEAPVKEFGGYSFPVKSKICKNWGEA